MDSCLHSGFQCYSEIFFLIGKWVLYEIRKRWHQLKRGPSCTLIIFYVIIVSLKVEGVVQDTNTRKIEDFLQADTSKDRTVRREVLRDPLGMSYE